MKKALFILKLLLAIQGVQAQPAPKPRVIDTTYIKGTPHPVYLGARGGQYIIVMKKDSTGTYKKYLPSKPIKP